MDVKPNIILRLSWPSSFRKVQTKTMTENQLDRGVHPGFLIKPEAEFLDEIKTKVLRVFLHAIHGHLYSFALRFIFLQNHATS